MLQATKRFQSAISSFVPCHYFLFLLVIIAIWKIKIIWVIVAAIGYGFFSFPKS